MDQGAPHIVPESALPAASSTIELAVHWTPDQVAAFPDLVPQLSPGRTPPSPTELQAILDDEGLHLLVARAPDRDIAGAIALVFYRVPTGLHARIEDLVVSRDHRGQGLGKALVQRAIQVGRQQHAHAIDLTPNPSRMEANRLYLVLGFRDRETNVCGMVLDRPQGPAGSAWSPLPTHSSFLVSSEE